MTRRRPRSRPATRHGPTRDVKVELTKPAKKDISLQGRVYFPVQHSIALLAAAKESKGTFRADLYDGSEKGEKVYDTVSFIGRRRAPGQQPQAAASWRTPSGSIRSRPGRCRSAISSRARTPRTRCRSTS